MLGFLVSLEVVKAGYGDATKIDEVLEGTWAGFVPSERRARIDKGPAPH